MKINTQYAQALHILMQKTPEKKDVYLKNLRTALKKRGHEKLLPSIFAEYQKLDLKDTREGVRTTTTSEWERTRTLLELYRKLITSHE